MPGGRILVPVWLHVDERRPAYFPLFQSSWWEVCRAWLRYHAIQVRWDIERKLARLFGKRWGA